jgi:thiol-disulfide isomerase/thioredoxin
MNAASAQTATRQRAPGSNKYWPAGGDEMGIDSQGRGVALVVTRKGAFAALSVAGFALLLADTAKTVARLKPLVHGEIAALTLASQPKPLPELSFSTPDGAKASLADFKGRTVLFNLWATWCVPCRLEMPALDRLQDKLDAKDFAVVAVNVDTARLDRPKAFLDEIGAKNLTLYADNKAAVVQSLKQAGKVLGLPTTILIGKDGCELGILAGPAQWDSQDALTLFKAI